MKLTEQQRADIMTAVLLWADKHAIGLSVYQIKLLAELIRRELEKGNA